MAIGLSFVLLIAYQSYIAWKYPPVNPPASAEQGKPGDAQGQQPVAGAQAPTVASGDNVPAPLSNRASAVSAPQTTTPVAATLAGEGPKVTFANAFMQGEVNLKGGRLTDIRFLKHQTSLDEDGEPIRFFSTEGNAILFQESRFLPGPGNGIKMPDGKALWTVVGDEPNLTSGGSLRLAWNNGEGVTFEKLFTFEPEGYLFRMEDRVVNQSDQPLTFYHFTQFKRVPVIAEEDLMMMADFQGPMGYLDGERYTHSYDDVREGDIYQQAHSGWAGFSDKYFLAALLPEQPAPQGAARRYYFDYDLPTFRVGMVNNTITVAPGMAQNVAYKMYAGPKEIETLESYGLLLERSIDYGWFHFLAVPLVKTLLFFNSFVMNFGLSIILLTLLIKLIFFPLANKSYRSMNAMKKLQPKIEELKKLYGSDRNKMNQEMMNLYQTHKVNPLGGCLPILIQIPVFFALYKVLFLSIEMRHAPFMAWIGDLSAKDPFFVLPLLMGASMFIQTKLNPTPSDPMQAKIMLFLPVIFTVMFLGFPSGLVLYWLVNNVLSISQQWYIMKKMG
uniref:Membrane protein insertase YidC n=1 Tax=Magnetococcus massalia (strain MO-1) TaxID=451514 RepID=A0A1S7LL39_MAGMO|nr:Cytoplasmic insertase into membrane protein, Sec system [Candidatus Magnetococcus massalia]